MENYFSIYDDYYHALESSWKEDMDYIYAFVRKYNNYVREGILSDDILKLERLLTKSGKYPNLTVSYDNCFRLLDVHDLDLYEGIVAKSTSKKYRLNYQYWWFSEQGAIPSKETRRTFIHDFSNNVNLLNSFRTVWMLPNTDTINVKGVSRHIIRERGHGSYKKLLFPDIASQKRFLLKQGEYEILRKYIIHEFERMFPNEIYLNKRSQPRIFSIRKGYDKRRMSNIMAATFWDCLSNNPGYRNMINTKRYVYNGLVKFINGSKSPKSYFSGHDVELDTKFIITLTIKNSALKRLLVNIENKEFEDFSLDDPHTIYKSWIVDGELASAFDLSKFTWSIKDSLKYRYIHFRDVQHLMAENNPNGITSVIESLFEDEKFNRLLNKHVGDLLPERRVICTNTGNFRENYYNFGTATSMAYPDVTAKGLNCKPVYIQIKDLGKAVDAGKKSRVLVDNLKSLFGYSDGFKNLTVNIVHPQDIRNVLNTQFHQKLLDLANSENAGIINIGAWKFNAEIPGISKFGEIYSALRITHVDKNLKSAAAVEKAITCLKSVGMITDQLDEQNTLSFAKSLEEIWSNNVIEMLIRICNDYGLFFCGNPHTVI